MRVSARLTALAAVLVLVVGVAPVAGASADEESRFVSLINSSRTTAGLAPLTVYGGLVDDARRHTGDMIARGTIFHSSSSQLGAATSGWSLLGENVGMGPDPDVLHSAFMASPTHKANILGAFDRVGVGAERAPDGTLFVTVMFMQTASTPTTVAPPPPPPPPPPPAPPPAPVSAGPVSSAPAETATAAATAPTPAPVPQASAEVAGWPSPDAPGCVAVRHFGATCMN